MKVLLYMIIFVFFYKLLSNGIFFIRANLFKKKYHDWLFVDENIPITVYKPILKSILKRADIEDRRLPMVQPVGYGQIATGTVSIIDNFPNRFEDHAIAISRMIDEAIGVFKQRFIETFNPLYWLDLIIFLPKTILSYLGLNPENVLVKIFNIIWWMIVPIALIFREQFTQFILDLFSLTK